MKLSKCHKIFATGILFLGLMNTFPLFAQENPKLRLNIIPRIIRQRTDAPIPVFVQSDWQGTAPITGVLEMEIFFGNQKVYTTCSQPLSFPPGDQNRAMMLPPLPDYTGVNTSLKMSFLTKNAHYNIPIQRLMLLEQNARCFSIGIVSTPFIRRQKFKPGEALRLEKLIQKKDEINLYGRTGTTFINVNQLPGTVPEYCAFDIILIQGEAFAEMSKRQLKVLKKWVCSGGALCLMIQNTDLEREHLDFMNSMIKVNLKPASPFLLKKGKLLLPEDFPETKPGTYRPGLGRMVIFPRQIKTQGFFAGKNWRYASAFLWRVRFDRMNDVINRGTWFSQTGKNSLEEKKKKQYASAYSDYGNYNRWEQTRLGNSLTNIINHNNQLFLSKTFQMIPTWLLTLILISLVIVVGPLDYIVLGKLGCRRLTWYVFPLICIAYTILTIFFAKHYMGVKDHIGSLTIIDEGIDGTVLRKTTYEVVFTASSKTLVRPCKNAFFTRQMSENQQLNLQGQLFSQYSASFDMKQWVPQINRINAFTDEKTDHPEWQFPAQINMGKKKNFKNFEIPGKRIYMSVLYGGKVKNSKKTTTDGNDFINTLIPYMDSAHCSDSLFAYISGMSPTPEYGKNELTMVDGTDEKEVLVIVGIHNLEKRSITIYRRLYLQP